MHLVKFPKIALTLTTRDGDKSKTVVQTAQDLLAQALATPLSVNGQPTNPTLGDLEKRIPLRKKISDAKDSVLLEQSEWDFLCQAISLYRWPWVHEDVLKVCHAVLEAGEREVEVKPNRAARRRKG